MWNSGFLGRVSSHETFAIRSKASIYTDHKGMIYMSLSGQLWSSYCNVWFGKSVQVRNIASDLCPISNHTKWHARHLRELWPTCKELATKRGSSCKIDQNWQVVLSFLTLKMAVENGEYPWIIEYSWVNYDLLVCNLGGTCDLTDQFPSNCLLAIFSCKSFSEPLGVWYKCSISNIILWCFLSHVPQRSMYCQIGMWN